MVYRTLFAKICRGGSIRQHRQRLESSLKSLPLNFNFYDEYFIYVWYICLEIIRIEGTFESVSTIPQKVESWQKLYRAVSIVRARMNERIPLYLNHWWPRIRWSLERWWWCGVETVVVFAECSQVRGHRLRSINSGRRSTIIGNVVVFHSIFSCFARKNGGRPAAFAMRRCFSLTVRAWLVGWLVGGRAETRSGRK